MPNEKNNHRILAVFPAYNEEGKIGKAVSSIPRGVVDEIIVIDDGSSDRTASESQRAGAKVLTLKKTEGVGNAIRHGIHYAQKNNFSIMVILAGNSKDDGSQIPRLTTPITVEGCDFVQGSRFKKGGMHGNTPLYRLFATKYLHPIVFSIFTGKRITDSTNGFRAIRLRLFNDARINIGQDWLNKYELEPYIFFKAIRLGYNVKEVPVSKIYPRKELSYTKMKPLTDWWRILKPVFFLGLGIKK